MNSKNQVIKTLEMIDEYLNKKNPTGKDIVLLTNDVYNLIIDDYRKKIIKSPLKITVEECEDTADVLIDLSNILIVNVIRNYSLDTTSALYELSDTKSHKLKKHLSKLLLLKKNDIMSTELFSCLFTFSYLPSISNAIKNRKLVLSQKQKMKAKK